MSDFDITHVWVGTCKKCGKVHAMLCDIPDSVGVAKDLKKMKERYIVSHVTLEESRAMSIYDCPIKKQKELKQLKERVKELEAQLLISKGKQLSKSSNNPPALEKFKMRLGLNPNVEYTESELDEFRDRIGEHYTPIIYMTTNSVV